MTRACISLVLIVGFLSQINAQFNNPKPGHVFDDSEVPRVDILIHPDSLAAILDTNLLNSNHEYPATFIFSRSNDRDTMENIGFRLRGNTSRASGKKSFKVAFNSFESGRDYKGMEKLNLNGEAGDPVMMRSKLCWDLYASVGIIASRSNHVNLFINDVYHGIYTNVEHIDEEFIQKRIKDDNGNLYKCLYPADLVYKGSDPNIYKIPEPWGRLAYDLKTNKDEDNYEDLTHFIDVLNNTPDADFECVIEQVFEVDNFLRVIAMDILVSNWDGPIFNKNNFYLYHNPTSGKFIYIPYDLDNTFGNDWFGIDWPNTNIYDWAELSGQPRPIFDRFMSTPQYRNRVNHYFNQYLSNHFNSSFLNQKIQQLRNLIDPFAQIDTFAQRSFGWTFEDYENAFDFALGGHVAYGLRPYIDLRFMTATDQLEPFNITPFIENINIEWQANQITFSFQVEDEQDLLRASAKYRVNNGSWKEKTLNPIGQNQYEWIYSVDDIGTMEYRIYVEDRRGNHRHFPFCESSFVQLGYDNEPLLSINEIMASNQNTVVDENGDFDDWVEIFNRGTGTVNLAEFYLSDRLEEAQKWQLPSIDLAPGDYYIIWADKDEEQGDAHANFKLSSGGEFIGLFDMVEGAISVIDSLTYPAQNTDVSYARIPNGIGSFIFDHTPTFGTNNEEGLYTVEPDEPVIFLTPNPASSSVEINGLDKQQIESVRLFSLAGQHIETFEGSNEIPLKGVASGQYILKVFVRNATFNLKLVVIND